LEENQKLSALIPEKDKKYANKLTVVIELDEVLLYSFTPTEEQGYMQAPARY
jgi:RNA polymerase II subunit A small phosphatase-like protein/CTD small phosphatase-like protein 2